MLITHCSALLCYFSYQQGRILLRQTQISAQWSLVHHCRQRKRRLQRSQLLSSVTRSARLLFFHLSCSSVFPSQELEKSLFHTCREETLQDKSSLDLMCQRRPHKTVSVKYRTFNSINYYLYIETQQETCSFKMNNSLHAKLEKCILV